MDTQAKEQKSLYPGYQSEPLSFESATRIMDQSLFCKKVYQLISFKCFQPSPAWIASTLGSTQKEIVLALDALLTLKLIKRTENGYALTDRKYFTRISQIDTHLNFTEELLGELRGTLSYFFNGAVATNQKSIREFHESLQNSIQTFIRSSEEQPKEVLYTLSYSSGRVSPTEGDPS